jgi:hypothetical protein
MVTGESSANKTHVQQRLTSPINSLQTIAKKARFFYSLAPFPNPAMT